MKKIEKLQQDLRIVEEQIHSISQQLEKVQDHPHHENHHSEDLFQGHTGGTSFDMEMSQEIMDKYGIKKEKEDPAFEIARELRKKAGWYVR